MLKDPWPESWDRYNLLERKFKKIQPDLTGVKMPKPVPLIVRLRYSHKKLKQIIKINFQPIQY
jgi:hypothetical protein